MKKYLIYAHCRMGNVHSDFYRKSDFIFYKKDFVNVEPEDEEKKIRYNDEDIFFDFIEDGSSESKFPMNFLFSEVQGKYVNYFTEEEVNDEEFIKEFLKAIKKLNFPEDDLRTFREIIEDVFYYKLIEVSERQDFPDILEEDEDDKNDKLEKEINKIKNDFSQMSIDLKNIKELLKKVLNMNNGGNE